MLDHKTLLTISDDFICFVSNSNMDSLDEAWESYINNVDKKIDSILKEAKEVEGEITWSGCNFYRNTGKNEFEPIGSATSMHECLDTCNKDCNMKRAFPIWNLLKNS